MAKVSQKRHLWSDSSHCHTSVLQFFSTREETIRDGDGEELTSYYRGFHPRRGRGRGEGEEGDGDKDGDGNRDRDSNCNREDE